MSTLTTLPSPPPASPSLKHPAPSSNSSRGVVLSSSPGASSYTASLPPTYRRSSFPLSPHALHPASSSSHSSSSSATPSFTFLPGLHLEQKGCHSDEDDTLARRFDALRVQHGGFDDQSSSSSSRGGSSSSPPSSRKSSASSFDSFSASNACSSGTATPLSSLAGSVHGDPSASLNCGRISALNASSASTSTSCATASGLSAFDWSASPPPPLAPPPAAKRSLSAGSGMDKAKREAVKGWEDPALAAARRALWDDVPDDEVQKKQKEAPAEEVFVEEDEEEGEGEDEDGEWEDADEDDWQLPPARPATSPPTPTGPIYSCLRNSSSSRSATSLACSLPPLDSSSASSSSLSLSHSHSRATSPTSCSSPASSAPPSLSASVSFSPNPPHTCTTYSSRAYSRRGDAPVEKLSIREWMELQGVREAVGVWSGKIEKWDEAAMASPAAACGAVASGGAAERKGRSPYQLAAVVGVVQVARSTPNSPTSPARGLPDF
ncbi:hypothetical protein JCM8097_003348 [Rhodosporidiobolus ruineniae]